MVRDTVFRYLELRPMSFEDLFARIKIFKRPDALTEEDYAAVTLEAVQSVAVPIQSVQTVSVPIQLWTLKSESDMSLKENQVYIVRTLEEQLNMIERDHGEAAAQDLYRRCKYPDPWLKEFYKKWATFTPGNRHQSGQMDTGTLMHDTINEIKIHVPEFTNVWGITDPDQRRRNLDKIALTEMGRDLMKLIYLKIHADIRVRNSIQGVPSSIRTSTDFTLDRPEGTNVSWTSALAGLFGLGGGNVGVGQVGPMRNMDLTQPLIMVDESRIVSGQQTLPSRGDVDAILGIVGQRYMNVLEKKGLLKDGTPSEIAAIMEWLGEMTRIFAQGLNFSGKDPTPGIIDQKALDVAANGVVKWINKDGPHLRTFTRKGGIQVTSGRPINAFRGNTDASSTLNALKSISGRAIEDIGYKLFPEDSKFPFEPYAQYSATEEIPEDVLREAGMI